MNMTERMKARREEAIKKSVSFNDLDLCEMFSPPVFETQTPFDEDIQNKLEGLDVKESVENMMSSRVADSFPVQLSFSKFDKSSAGTDLNSYKFEDLKALPKNHGANAFSLDLVFEKLLSIQDAQNDLDTSKTKAESKSKHK